MGLATVLALGLLLASGCDDADGTFVTVTLPENAVLLSPDGEPLLDNDRVHFELFVAEQQLSITDGVRKLERSYDNDDLMKDVTIAKLKAGYDVQLTSATAKTIQMAVAVWSRDDELPGLGSDIAFAPLEVNVEPGVLRKYQLPLVTQLMARNETQPEDCDGDADSRVAAQAYVWGEEAGSSGNPDWHCLRWVDDDLTLVTMTWPDDRDCDGPLVQSSGSFCPWDEDQCNELDTPVPDGEDTSIGELQEIDLDGDGYTDVQPGVAYNQDGCAACMLGTSEETVNCDCPIMDANGDYVTTNYLAPEICDGYDNDCNSETWVTGLNLGDPNTLCGGPSGTVCMAGRTGCAESADMFNEFACVPETGLDGTQRGTSPAPCAGFICSSPTSCIFPDRAGFRVRQATTSTIVLISTPCTRSYPIAVTADFGSTTATCRGKIWGADVNSGVALTRSGGIEIGELVPCTDIRLQVKGNSPDDTSYMIVLSEVEDSTIVKTLLFPVTIEQTTTLLECPAE